jgi:STE24 endopeptidase
MNTRHFLLGVAAGLTAGYAAMRAFQSVKVLASGAQRRRPDAAEYGALRRALLVSGIARSLAANATLAYGPLGARLERSVERLPVWLRPAAFVAEVTLLETLGELPVDFVEGYGIEHRYGLSEQSAASWLADHAKQSAIGGGVAAVLASALAAALRKFPNSWPYVSSAGIFPLLIVANIAIPIYILPLFNTYEPLTGPLERRLRALAERYGVGDAEILRMNMSKQTKKANAFVIGIGNTHRIVVGDTLIEHFPDEEIEFVVAHELGHYVSKDTWRMIAISQIASMAILFGAFFLEQPSSRSGAVQRAQGGNADTRKLARIQLWATLLSQLLRPAVSAFSRSREWAADRFALQTTNAPRTGASAFRRLRDQNLSEDEQPAWFEFLFSTHPSLRARIDALESSAALETGKLSLD